MLVLVLVLALTVAVVPSDSAGLSLTLCALQIYLLSRPTSSSWWRTPNRPLPYWRLVAKYPYLLPSSMLCGPQSSGAGHPHLAVAMTRWWSSSGAERVRCPKNLRWKDFTLSETGKHPVILRTISLVVSLVCLVYGIRRIFRKHQVSKASKRFSRVLVTVHVLSSTSSS